MNPSGVSLKTLSSFSTPAAPLGNPRWLMVQMVGLFTCRLQGLDPPVFLQGVLHTVSGYMLYTATTFKLVFDHQPDDVYWCTADIGWITGHSYITYGPLANGATSVLVSSSWSSTIRQSYFTVARPGVVFEALLCACIQTSLLLTKSRTLAPQFLTVYLVTLYWFI